MQQKTTIAKTTLCRSLLKVTSAVFLLFLACFISLTPVVAQIGSVLFIFFVIIFSPQNTVSAAPEQIKDRIQDCEYSLLDLELSAHDIHLQRTSRSRQNWHNQTPVADSSRSYELVLYFSCKKNNLTSNTKKQPDKWLYCRQPVRAGPFDVYI